MSLKHKKISAKADSSDTSIIQPSDWNDSHIADELGVVFGEEPGTGIKSIAAGQNYLRTLRRKFNASPKEEYEFVDAIEYVSSDYDFPSQTPSGNLTASVTSIINIAPVPLGVNGTDIEHWILIQDATNGNEIIKIQGGTALSGSETGNLIVTPILNHTEGNYSIRSATAGIQEALNLLPSDGGRVSIPKGRFNIYSSITVNKDCTELVGCNGTYLHAQSTLKVCLFNVDGGSRIASSIRFRNFQTLGLGAGTDGIYAFIFKRQNTFTVDNVLINHFHHGIKIADWDCFRGLFHDINIGYLGVNGRGIDISAGADFYVTDCVINAANDGSGIGIRIEATGGVWIHNVDTMNCYNGLLLCPKAIGAYENCSWIWVSDCAFDTGKSNGIVLQPTGGGEIVGVFFDNSWSASSVEGHGVVLDASNGKIRSVNFAGCRILGNAKDGMHIDGAEIKYLNIINNFILENNAESAGAGANSGITVYNGPSFVNISNNQIIGADLDSIGGVGGITRKHGAGIVVDTGLCKGLVVTGNIVEGIKVSHYINNSTSPEQVWANNYPAGSLFSKLVDAATVTLVKTDSNNYFIEGTVGVSTINGGRHGQVIYVQLLNASTAGFITGGNITIPVGRVFKQYETVALVYNGANIWSIVS